VTRGILVFDTSPLCHFARAGELATLRKLVVDFDCVTTKAVRAELRKGIGDYPALQDALNLDWVAEVPCDDLTELYLFGQYMNLLGNLERNAGEASVLAWAEAHSAAAYVDDQVAHDAGRRRGVSVFRTLRLVISAYRAGGLDESKAQELIERLADNDARFPNEARRNLFGWARSQNPPLL
jgi:predicted nucleic acid-binding protein